MQSNRFGVFIFLYTIFQKILELEKVDLQIQCKPMEYLMKFITQQNVSYPRFGFDAGTDPASYDNHYLKISRPVWTWSASHHCAFKLGLNAPAVFN